MSTVENYDGLCGITHLYASSGKQVKCTYEFGHHGEHSWVNKKVALHIFGGCINHHYHEDKFVESVMASIKK